MGDGTGYNEFMNNSDATGMDFDHPQAPGIWGLFSPLAPIPRGSPGFGDSGISPGILDKFTPGHRTKMESSVGIQQIEH